jgi:hypothetical protein
MKPEIPPPRVVVKSTTRRDIFVAVIAGLLILSFVLYGISHLGKREESRNILVGVVAEKQFTPRKEEQVSFSGRRIEGVKQIDGDYVLKVRVEKENRTYDVPVEKPIYESRKVGDKMEFVRPRSEQR